MKYLTTLIDQISRVLAGIVMVMLVTLVCVMLFEVFMRRVLNAPTLWAFDVAYMLNGCLFIGGASYALLKNEHVRIDFLAARFSPRVRCAIEAGFFLFMFLPALGLLAQATTGQAFSAFMTGETERVSPWAPRIWPYYTGLAVGVCGLWLQGLAECIKCIGVLLSGEREAARVVALAEGRE
jgi:TRAP-type mannitol/chloroaromatic compound transport system permease small subunit